MSSQSLPSFFSKTMTGRLGGTKAALKRTMPKGTTVTWENIDQYTH
jgi:hypothetical protein